MGRASRGKAERRAEHDCDEVERLLAWQTADQVICLACNNPMPRGGSAGFTPLGVGIVFVSFDGAEPVVTDAVHLACLATVEGAPCQWGPFAGVVVANPASGS